MSRYFFFSFFTLSTLKSNAQIVINELGISPPSHNSGGGSEFVELYNKSGCSVDIGCYVIVFSSTSTNFFGTFATGWAITIPSNTLLASDSFYLIGGGGNASAFTSSSWQALSAGGNPWINLYGTNGKDIADLDISTSSNSAKNNIPGLLTDQDGQVTLLKPSGAVEASVSYNSGNNSSSYPGSLSNGTPVGCTPFNPIPLLSASLTNINYLPSFNSFSQGIYLDASGTYQIAFSNLTPSLTPGKPNISQLAPAVALTATATGTNVNCFGGTTGTATVTPAEGTPAYTYSWNTTPVQTTATATNLAAGTYTVTVTDNEGCTTTATLTITVNPNITPTFNAVAPICSGATLAVLPTSSTNATPITGTWSPALNNTATTTYTFTPAAGQCATTATLTITVNPNITPTFNAVAPICSGATLTVLPPSSTNATPITGTWSPALNNTATTIYTFTPAAGQCATTATLTITVNPNITPTFNAVAPICSGATLTALPPSSTNATPITGTWSPALNNTATTIYTFTPAAGQCATTATLTITVNPNITPTFNAVAPICSGATLAVLPTSSTNATPITGTWSPALNNTATTTYTFTPTAGQCATTATLTITVNPNITPTFNAVAPICSGATLAALPTSSTNATPITGTWSPALNNTATTTYTFTPTAGQCATTATMDVVITNQITPAFTQIGSLCQNSAAPSLPATSTNGINGTWSPATINTTAVGTTTYTFTATAGQCATTATMDIVITAKPIADAPANVTSCASYTLPALVNGTYYSSPNGVGPIAVGTVITSPQTVYVYAGTSASCSDEHSFTVTITTIVTPSVSIAASTTSICAGSSITFTATPTNGGSVPTYQWQVNGTNVPAATSSTFTATTLNNGDKVTVVMTSNASCTTTPTATSNAIIVATSSVTPSVSIAASTTSICAGSSITFTATPTNGGSVPTYQWQVNGTNVPAATSSTFTATTLNNGDKVTVVMTSNASCTTTPTATSNAIIVATSSVTPSVSIAASSTSICAGSSITFTATPTNGGSVPTYQWQVNGTNVPGSYFINLYNNNFKQW